MPEVQIPFVRPDITEEDVEAVSAVLRSQRLAMGEQALAFEKMLAEQLGVKHALVLSNGTAALQLALLAAGVRAGDEVITTAFTYVATTNAILHAGATPVFVDIDPATLNLDVHQLPGALTPRTKAILPVHVFGRPCDMDAIAHFSREHGLPVIEDACEALGSRYHGTAVGGIGLAGTLGFAQNKQITTGEGGALLTNSDEVADFVHSARRQGRSSSCDSAYVHAGFNYKMSDLQAALGLSQLRRLADRIRARSEAAALYRDSLKGVEGITLPAPAAPGTEISWFVWVILVEKGLAGTARDGILQRLNERGVGAQSYFPALHLQPSLQERFHHQPGDLPITEDVSSRSIALPLYPGITAAEIDTVKRFLAEELDHARTLTAAR